MEVKWIVLSFSSFLVLLFVPVIIEIQWLMHSDISKEVSQTSSEISNFPVIVTILSKSDNFAARKAARETWMNLDSYKNLSLYDKNFIRKHFTIKFVLSEQLCEVPERFLVDKYSCDLNRVKMKSNKKQYKLDRNHLLHENSDVEQRLKEEQENYNDLHFVPGVESYSTLTAKVFSIFGAFGHEYKAILKSDDDTIVRLDRLLQFMYSDEFAKISQNRYFLLGRYMGNMEVHREGKAKELDYKKDTYPRYPHGGSGYFVPRSLANLFLEHKGRLYHGEDTTLAIWIEEIEEERKAHIVEKISLRDRFNYDQQCSSRTAIVVGHRLRPKDIHECFYTPPMAGS